MKKEFLLTIVTTVAAVSLSYGILQNQVSNNTKEIAVVKENHAKDIENLSDRQNKSDVLLNSINNNLASLNTKMDLLLSGKLKQGDN